jgi:hypothetical protein
MNLQAAGSAMQAPGTRGRKAPTKGNGSKDLGPQAKPERGSGDAKLERARLKGGPRGQGPDTGSKDLWSARIAPRGGYRMRRPQGLDRKVTSQDGHWVQPAAQTRKWPESWCVANSRNGEGSARAHHRAGAMIGSGLNFCKFGSSIEILLSD